MIFRNTFTKKKYRKIFSRKISIFEQKRAHINNFQTVFVNFFLDLETSDNEKNSC